MSLLPCYCMTQSQNLSMAVTGLCPYTCRRSPLDYYQVPQKIAEISELSSALCKNFNREGQMCGLCKKNFAPAVYSYTVDCINCINYEMNWLKYVAVAFGPPTLFFIAVLTIRLSVTSGTMVGFVTVCQVLATSVEARFKTVELGGDLSIHYKVIFTLYSIWNLDFFRPLYPPFCLHPNMSMLLAISLDYVIALYPVILVLMTFVVSSIYDKYCHFYMPHFVLHRYRRVCDIRNSVIDAFVTALVISYVKILNTSFELLLYSNLKDLNGKFVNRVVYYNGDLTYLGKEHIPYFVLALLMSLIFNIFPVVLVTLYPFRCLQYLLNKHGKKLQVLGIHNIMDVFYKCYKTNCRYFAVAYLYLRIIDLALLEIALSPVYFSLISILYLCMAVAIGLIQPYKVKAHNFINSFLFSVIAVLKIFEYTVDFTMPVYEDRIKPHTYLISELTLYYIPPLYGAVLLLYYMSKSVALHIWLRARELNRFHDESLPHRLSRADEYAHLLSVSS